MTTIPIYKNTQVKHWSNAWKDVKSFDILTAKQVSDLYQNAHLEISEYKIEDQTIKNFVDGFNHTDVGNPAGDSKDMSERFPDSKFIYLEIPYKFYEDHMTEWHMHTGGVPFKIIKHFIKIGKKWDRDDFDYMEQTPTHIFSYRNYFTFKKYGIATPIFNNALVYPFKSTHITGYSSIIKSDIPILMLIPKNTLKWRTEIDKSQPPLFNESYLVLEIDIENKRVDFFLENNKHIGVYKYETKV